MRQLALAIKLDQSGPYLEGQVITGHVTLTSPRKNPVVQVFATFVQEIVTRMMRQDDDDEMLRMLKTDRKHPIRMIVALQPPVDLVPDQNNTVELPFSFQIPTNLEGSLKGPAMFPGGKAKYEINYRFVGSIFRADRPNTEIIIPDSRLDLRIQEERRIWDFPEYPREMMTVRVRKEMGISWDSIGWGSLSQKAKDAVHATLIFQRNHAVTGEKLTIMVGLRNNSSKMFKELHFALKKTASYKVVNGTSEIGKLSKEYIQLEPQACLLEPHEDNKTVTCEIPIPKDIAATTPSGSRKIQISYALRVSLAKSGTLEPALHLVDQPILIVQVPFAVQCRTVQVPRNHRHTMVW